MKRNQGMPYFIHQGYYAELIHDRIADAPLADCAHETLVDSAL